MVTQITTLAGLRPGYILVRLDAKVNYELIMDDLFKKVNEYFLIEEITNESIKLRKATVSGRNISNTNEQIATKSFFSECCWYIQTQHIIPDTNEEMFEKEIKQLRQLEA